MGLHWFSSKSLIIYIRTLLITTKQLIPVVVATVIFDPQWNGHLVQFSVDNLAMVHILTSTYSKDTHLMHLVLILIFLSALFDFWFIAKEKANSLADDLSYDNVTCFFSQAK